MNLKIKRIFLITALFLFLLSPVFLISLQEVFAVRVACVGDSITYGSKIENRTLNSYPSRLQQLLGARYLVKNFGARGYTLQKSGNFPYWSHSNFQKSTEFQPDIVLIMLGTNDSKSHNWIGTEAFLEDYSQIVLMTPASVYPKNFNPSNPYKIRADIVDIIADAVLQLAEDENLPVIDIHQATDDHPEYFLLDGVHPDDSGAEKIAELAFEAILDCRQ